MTVPEVSYAALPDRLKQLRQEFGWSLSKVAAVTGVMGRQVAGKWERGARVPELRTLLILANWYGCSLDYLVGRSDTRDSEAVIAGRQSVAARIHVERQLPGAPSDRFRLVYRLMQEAAPDAFFLERAAAVLLLTPETLATYITSDSPVPADTIQRFSLLSGLPAAWYYSQAI